MCLRASSDWISASVSKAACRSCCSRSFWTVLPRALAAPRARSARRNSQACAVCCAYDGSDRWRITEQMEFQTITHRAYCIRPGRTSPQLELVERGAAWFTDKMPLNETHLGLTALLSFHRHLLELVCPFQGVHQTWVRLAAA